MTGDRYEKLITSLNTLLDGGCTASDIKNEMCNAVSTGQPFHWKSIRNSNMNMIKSNTRYYHRELLSMARPSVVDHNINEGTFVSQQDDFYVEPRASYTMDEFLEFFYAKTDADKSIYPHRRMAGYFRTIIKNFGIDTTLFLIEAISRTEPINGSKFDVDRVLEYIPTAQSFLNDVKQNCTNSGGDAYVIKKRVPPV